MAESEFSALKRTFQINKCSPLVVKQCEKELDETGRRRLLQQQIDALSGVTENSPQFKQRQIVLISMPTGTGKTGVIACLPYYLGNIKPPGSDEPRYRFDKPILVIAPNLAIRDQLEEELTVNRIESRQPFLIRTGIVPLKHQADVLPIPLIIQETSEVKNGARLKTTEIVIANAQKFLATNWEDHLDDDFFRLVIVDEAHHHPATTWRRIVKKFCSPECPVFFFTATPYRSDGEDVLPLETSCIAYHLPLKEAVKKGIIRQTNFQELDTYGDIESVHLRNPVAEKEIRDMQRMIPILGKVKELLDQQREATSSVEPEVPHMAIAIAKDTVYANRLLELWKALYRDEDAECYHSKNQANKDEIMAKLKNNKLSLVIIVGMLLEGFDHPPISIAAITHNIQSRVKFVQFVGRAQRIYRQDEYTDNLCAHIVTHIDYNQRENYQNFVNERFIPVTDVEAVDEN